MEKYHLAEQRENESNELKKAREFFIDALPLIDPAVTEKMTPKQLFGAYQNFINNNPSFEHFQKIAAVNGGQYSFSREDIKSNSKIQDLWKKYLIKKLPCALVERQMEIQKVEDEEYLDADKLETLHKKRLEAGHKMVLGFHVTDNQIDGDIFPSKTPTTLVSDEIIDIPAGRTFYSTSPQSLYKQRSKYLVFVEGDQHEIDEQNKKIGAAHGGGEWVSTNRKLPTLKSFDLTALIDPLELKSI